MTLTEARKILGIGPDEDPRPHLNQFREVREKIAEMVRTAPNEMLAARYQEGLVEFDQALAAVREYLEALGLMERVADVKVEEARGHAVFTQGNVVKEKVGPRISRQGLDESTGRIFRIVAASLALLSVIGFSGWLYLKIEEDKELNKRARIAFLERQGAIFIENRRWQEAEESFAEIETMEPESEMVMMGRRSIEAGMAEEQHQFIGYWQGEAKAAFDESRWDDAEKAAQQVLAKYPDEKEVSALVAKIADAKRLEWRQEAFSGVREKIAKRDFDGALATVRALLDRNAGDTELEALLGEVEEAKKMAEENLAKAKELSAMAEKRDNGEFDEQAINWMREALALAPGDAAIKALYEKMAAYTRTIRVPEDVKTAAEALSSARERDRIVLADGVWEGPLVIAAGVQLEGVSGKTIIECAADAGSVLSIAPGVKGARVSGLTVRHRSFDAGEERFSLALVRGAEVDFSDCRFEQGSGHGIAVMGGGHAKVMRCRFTENGWNGIAVTGEGSHLEAEKSILTGNFQNGIEAWEGAAAVLTGNECTGNSRNGIHIDSGNSATSVRDNTLEGNREFGLVLSGAGGGEISGNTIGKNILGGMVVKVGGAKVEVKANTIRANEGPGLVLEKGIADGSYGGNNITGNTGDEVLKDIDLSAE